VETLSFFDVSGVDPLLDEEEAITLDYYTYPVTSIFSKFDSSHHLLVNEIGCNRILSRIMPRGVDFFPEEESPRGVAFLCTLFFCILFTLRDCIHDVITTTAK
jgi:hypothetical protein